MSDNTSAPVVLITGAAKRIGAATAALFHNAGYRVVVHYNRSAKEADKLCETLNQQRADSCLLVQSDLNDMAGLDKIVALIESIGRLDVLVNGVVVDALSSLTHRGGSVRKGRDIVKKLSKELPRQLFEVAVQAAVNGAVVARETVSAMRKNVVAKCYGGDVSRKKKLLSRQKEGKKRMRRVGNVDVPLEAFAGLLGTRSGK